MENLNFKIQAYLGRLPDYREEVIIEENIIVQWNISEKSKPTDAELNALETEANKLKNNNIALGNRQKEYGSLAEQLEYITENGLDAWQTKVQEIKTKYPKESE